MYSLGAKPSLGSFPRRRWMPRAERMCIVDSAEPRFWTVGPAASPSFSPTAELVEGGYRAPERTTRP